MNLLNKLQWNLSQITCTKILVEENKFENVVCNMVAILFKPQYVNPSLYWSPMPTYNP